jgi:hypothetical protein
MRRAITIFCGKGGVGKTTLSLAFALRHAERGRKVLVVTSHPIPELAVTISLKGLKDSHSLAAANLFVIHIDPRDVLQRVVRQGIGSATLADAVLSSRIYTSLIEVIPGLKEIAFVSRMRELSIQDGTESADRFDLIVWDAPATGHFLRTLDVARNFDSYLSGPLSLLGKDLAGFLSDPAALVLMPVTILEEMAVKETMELCEKLIADLKIRPTALICNMTSPLLAASQSDWEETRRNFGANVKGSGNLNFIFERLAVERALFGRLRLAGSVPLHVVPRKPASTSDVELLLELAGVLSSVSNGPRL